MSSETIQSTSSNGKVEDLDPHVPQHPNWATLLARVSATPSFCLSDQGMKRIGLALEMGDSEYTGLMRRAENGGMASQHPCKKESGRTEKSMYLCIQPPIIHPLPPRDRSFKLLIRSFPISVLKRLSPAPRSLSPPSCTVLTWSRFP